MTKEKTDFDTTDYSIIGILICLLIIIFGSLFVVTPKPFLKNYCISSNGEYLKYNKACSLGGDVFYNIESIEYYLHTSQKKNENILYK